MGDERPIGLSPGTPDAGAGQDERKYGTRNPVVRRLIERWLSDLRTRAAIVPGLLCDVGVGEGLGLERFATAPHTLIGVEYRADKLHLARARLPGLAGVRGDAGMLPFRGGALDLVTCIETLEHLAEPSRAVRELARVTRDRCIVSVPWEPYFRAGTLLRGKNVARWGNDPEHVQQFTPRRLRALLSGSFAVVTVTRVFPWLVAEARSPVDGRTSR